jgi:hypothetical protein
VEWRLVLKTAAFAVLVVLAAHLIGGGSIELVSLLGGFGAAGYLATHRARNRPLVHGTLTVGLAVAAIFVGVAVTEQDARTTAKSMIVLVPFATVPGAIGVLAGHADRELRPRPPAEPTTRSES